MLHTELSRKIHFSSAHKYSHPQWSQDKNKEVFGSCFSEHGHGHNYILEAHFRGPVSHETGMIINLTDVDQILTKVVQPLDHSHLNFDIPEFKEKVPTAENLALYCYEKIHSLLGSYPDVRLSKVKLYEGTDLWSEVENASI